MCAAKGKSLSCYVRGGMVSWKPSENAPIRDGRHSTSLSGAFYARTVASVPLRATDVSSGAFAGVDNVDQALVIRPNAR